MIVKGIRITCSNGNPKNGIKGSQISFYGKDGGLLKRLKVPHVNGLRWSLNHPESKEGKKLSAILLELNIAITKMGKSPTVKEKTPISKRKTVRQKIVSKTNE